MTDETGWRALALAVHGPSGRVPGWHRHAACASEDPNLFDGGKHTSAQAKRICGRCPVSAECLADQMEWERRKPAQYRARIGVFGGKTSSEREAMHLAERQTSGQEDLFGEHQAA